MGKQERGGAGTATERRESDTQGSAQQQGVSDEDAKRIEQAHKVEPAGPDEVEAIPPEQEGVPVAAGTGHGPIVGRSHRKAVVKDVDEESNA